MTIDRLSPSDRPDRTDAMIPTVGVVPFGFGIAFASKQADAHVARETTVAARACAHDERR